MMTMTTHTIGSTAHRAPRGAYRTICGKSTELANRRKAYDECASCFSSWRERLHAGETVKVAAVRELNTGSGWIMPGETGTAWSAFYSRGEEWVNVTLPGGYEVATSADVWSEDIDNIGG